MAKLENLGREMRGDALNSLIKVKGLLNDLSKNMDLKTALKIKEDFEKNGENFDHLKTMIEKLRKATK